MKLVVNLKFKPSHEQRAALRETIERANAACDWISAPGWEAGVLKQFKLHKLVYHDAKDRFGLTAQMVVRCIAKVADAYKLDSKVRRRFRRHGSVAYDDRILRFKADESVSIWTLSGRQTIPFECGDYQRRRLPFRKGEIDLVCRKGEFYLNAVCDVDEPPPLETDDVLGCDFGIVNLLTDSDGVVYTGDAIEENRRRMAHRRRNLQRKGTKSAKRKLRQLSGKQRRFQTNENHRISKEVVSAAKGTRRAIAVEDLTGIRRRTEKTARKKQRARLSNWAFHQLRNFLTYKARLAGVEVIAVDPRNTSRECHRCHYTDKRNRPSQEKFLCQNCGYESHADFNASRNIRDRAVSTSRTVASAIKAPSSTTQVQAAAL